MLKGELLARLCRVLSEVQGKVVPGQTACCHGLTPCSFSIVARQPLPLQHQGRELGIAAVQLQADEPNESLHGKARGLSCSGRLPWGVLPTYTIPATVCCGFIALQGGLSSGCWGRGKWVRGGFTQDVVHLRAVAYSRS